MDWSLVLVSQGIETTIENPEEGGGCGLLVAAEDYDPALAAIRQYRLENRNWPWRQEVTGYLFDWGSLAWVLLLVVFFWLSGQGGTFHFHAVGIMDSTAVAHGQWWRLFTAVWLHADLAHLAANATIGFVLLGLAMGRYGTGAGLLAAYFAGAGGNLAAWLLSSGPHYSLGASGMVMGSLGLLTVPAFGALRALLTLSARGGAGATAWQGASRAVRHLAATIVGGVMIFVLLGLAPGSDVVAHLGGFVSGLLVGGLLAVVPELAKKTKANLICGMLFALLVIVPWWLALRSS